jgi:hypothetical protein
MKADKITVSFAAQLGDEVRKSARKTGKSLSAWLAEAAEAKLRNEALGEWLDEWERRHGPLTAEQIAQAEEELGFRSRNPAA